MRDYRSRLRLQRITGILLKIKDKTKEKETLKLASHALKMVDQSSAIEAIK